MSTIKGLQPRKSTMIWAARFFDIASAYTRQFDRFEKDYIGRGGPAAMMMVQVRSHDPDGHIIIIGLPNKLGLALYPGFEAISADQLPEAATLLIGQNAGFEERFSYATL